MPPDFQLHLFGGRADAQRRKETDMQLLDVREPHYSTFAPPLTGASVTTPDRARGFLDALLRRYAQHGSYSIEVEITPTFARLLLDSNEQNRSSKKRVIDHIASDIKAGRWSVNGETIILSPTGEVNDGQHRLMAVVSANTSIRTFLVIGMPRQTRETVDTTQSTRTPGDILRMKGIPEGNHVAAVAGYLWQVAKFGSIPTSAHHSTRRTSKQEIDQFAIDNLSIIREALDLVPQTGSQKIASRSLLAVAYILLREKDELAARQFMTTIISGVGLQADSPLYTVRERLMDDKRRRRVFDPRIAVELLIRAWNAHRQGRRLSKVYSQGHWPEISR